MHRIFALLLLFSVSLALEVKAQSDFVVFNEDGHRFWLIMNGVRQNDQPLHRVEVDDLWEPVYRIKIIFEDEKIPELDANVTAHNFMENTYTSSTYKLRKHRRKDQYVLRIISYQDLGPIDTSTTTDEKPEEHDPWVDDENTPEVIPPTEEENEEKPVPIKPPVVIIDPIHDDSRPEKPYVLPGYDGPTNCPKPINDDRIQQIINNIKRQSFEDDRLTTAKQMLRHDCILVSHLMLILNEFSFEDSKLEFAKYAYSRTFDIGRFYEINEVFSFSSSRMELNDFLDNQQ